MSSKELLLNGEVTLGEADALRCHTKIGTLQIGVYQYTCSITVVKILENDRWRSSYFVKIQKHHQELDSYTDHFQGF